MTTACFVKDSTIIWLQREKIGSPSPWQPNKNYKLGDLVVPRTPSSSQMNLMFQCVAFISNTGSVTPNFPSTPNEGQTFTVENVEYVARETSKDLRRLQSNEYYVLDRTIEVR